MNTELVISLKKPINWLCVHVFYDANKKKEILIEQELNGADSSLSAWIIQRNTDHLTYIIFESPVMANSLSVMSNGSLAFITSDNNNEGIDGFTICQCSQSAFDSRKSRTKEKTVPSLVHRLEMINDLPNCVKNDFIQSFVPIKKIESSIEKLDDPFFIKTDNGRIQIQNGKINFVIDGKNITYHHD
uniref:Uncharacterized protein n=1 Tax=Abalone asfa-like virus TaxID=2839893 RepID=A0A5K7Y3I8_9VIRU|nr:hypothetical protein [Abalone asfa-like virus]